MRRTILSHVIQLAAVSAIILLACSAISAQTLPAAVNTITSFPPPAPDAFATSMRFGTDGLIYAWDGQCVWRQSGVNVDSFGSAPIGTVPSNGADAGPINFSQDGQTLLIGNGSGGYDFSGSSSGVLYTMPATGGAATPAGTVLNHFDFIPVPIGSTLPGSATKFLIDAGAPNLTSEVDLFDFVSGKAVTIIRSIPGASSSIAFDAANRLYVSIGYGDHRGQIRRFTLPQLDLAASGTALDWNSGQLFNAADNNSGSGMFFDAHGNLFAGGPNGLAVFDPSGAGQFYSTGASSFPTISRNATNDQFALTLGGFNDPMNLGYSPLIYRAVDFHVPSPTPVTWNSGSGGNWTDASRWDQPAAPNGVDQRAVLGGAAMTPSTVALNAPITLGALTMNSLQKYLVSGPNALTMQVRSSIAAITVTSGSHEIAAPLVLASDTDVTVTNASDTLTLSGGIAGNGMLSKEGNGTLTISAANSYFGNTAVDGGRLRFQVASGTPSVSAGSIVTIASGATLELAGTISALGTTGGNRTHVINDSTASGLVISGKNQVVGGIDGSGSTTIDAGKELTADYIIQSALVISGNATDRSLVTIAASDADGNPLMLASSTAPGATSDAVTGRNDITDQFDAALQTDLTGESGEITSVPEPASSLLAVLGGTMLFFLRFHRRGR